MTKEPEDQPIKDGPPAPKAAAETPAAKAPAGKEPAGKEPGRFALFMQKLIRAAVAGLILVAIGMLAGYLLLRQEIESLSSSLATEEAHSQLLSALKDVQTAQIALATDQADEASLALTNTADKLETLRTLLPTENQGVIDGMLSRLDLALSGLGSDAVAAAADLSVLSNSLMQLENTLFTEP